MFSLLNARILEMSQSVAEDQGTDGSTAVDPNKLYLNRDGNALGFERDHGVEEVTNFSVEVAGYVEDGQGHVIGYILQIILAVVDPLDTAPHASK